MTESDPAETQNPADCTPHTLEWSVHPATEQPLRTVSVAILILGAGAVAAWWFESPVTGLLATVLLSALLLPFLLRTSYFLGPEEIEVRTALYSFRRPLAAFRSFEMGKDRAWLCTYRSRHVLDNYRGMLLLVGCHRERVRAALVERGLQPRDPGRGAEGDQ